MDTSSVSYNLFFLGILLLASAFFSAAETAFFSLNKLKIRNFVDNGVKNAVKVQLLLEKSDDLLTTILIMNNLINISASSLTTMLMYKIVGDAGVSIATGIVTILVLIFGEITPKSFAIQNSEKIALSIVRIIELFVFILKPIVVMFGFISSLVNKISKNKNSDSSMITEEELKTIVDVSEENGVLDTSEKEMIYNVFDFGDIRVKDIMVQKTNITGIDIDSSYDETMDIIKKEKYSRLPVYKQSIDSIVGILNVKDLLLNNIDENNFSLKAYIRNTNQTFEFKKVQDLLKEMKRDKCHMAVVLDEYGATKGIITMEDIIEEIIGDIDDEYDTLDDKEIKKISDKVYLVAGTARMTEIIDELNLQLEYNDNDYDSIGGYFIKTLDRFPTLKESITESNIRLTVIELEKKAIKKVKIELL